MDSILASIDLVELGSAEASCHTRATQRRRRRDRIAKFTMVVPVDVASATQRGDLAIVQSWLNNAGPDAVDDVCGSGNTCLMRSMASIGRVHERIEVLRFLISRGANVNVCDQTNWTPLHYACFQRTGSPEMVSLILHAGGSAGSVLEARTPLIGHSMYPDSTALGFYIALGPVCAHI